MTLKELLTYYIGILILGLPNAFAISNFVTGNNIAGCLWFILNIFTIYFCIKYKEKKDKERDEDND